MKLQWKIFFQVNFQQRMLNMRLMFLTEKYKATVRVMTAHCRGGVRSIFGYTHHKDDSTNQC